MSRFAHLQARIFNRPVAIHPEKAEIITAALADRLGIIRIGGAEARTSAMFDELDETYGLSEWVGGADMGYDVVEGIAVLPIRGTLTQRLGLLRPHSGMTGYDGIRQSFCTALEDPAVNAIMLDVDSPGGEVAGCFDLADMIFSARGAKPIWAMANECAYSAAYAIACAADKVVLPRTGGVGSVGVVCMHIDLSEALSKAGIAVTLIQYGAHKTDATDVKPLSTPAQMRLQADIDMIGALFVNTVAKFRGMTPAAVKATEAATFQGQAGVAAGLADAVMAPDAAFAALLAEL